MAYDIFISYKNTDNNQKTEDYYLALKLKKRLERENYNVFFSDEEIPKHKESIFSKIIEQALDEAKILVIVCTNPAYLKTSYVDYECSSFHDEIICGRKVGYIYGIGKNISHQELPYYLRRYDFYDFDNEMEKLILGINSFFTETREINNDVDIEENELINRFNHQQFQKYSFYNTEEYISESFNEFVELLINEKIKLSVIKYNKNNDALSAIYIKSKTLFNAGEKLIYLDKINEIYEVINEIDNNNEYLIIINHITEILELEEIFKYISNYPQLRFLIGVNSDNTEILEVVENDTLMYNFSILNEAETQVYLEDLSNKLSMALSSKLLSIILLPTLKEFRTPKMLKIILMNIKKLENYLDYDYNITDIFEVFDDYIIRTNEKVFHSLQQLINISLKKGLNKYSLLEIQSFKNDIDKLIELGFVTRQGSTYMISSKEYYYYQIAKNYFDENGLNYSIESFKHFKESIPYYIYQYYLSVEELLIDVFHLEPKLIDSLLQLFISEEEGFTQIVLSRKYDSNVLKFLKYARRTGIYSMALKIIEILENNNIPSSEEFDYLSEKIYIKFTVEGKLLETNETHGNIYYRKGYCYYCLDNYEQALKYFELAFEKMMNNNEIDYSLLFHYIELLLDVGDYQKTNILLKIYEENPSSDDRFISDYYFTKSLIATDNLEFSLSIDYLEHCIEQCNKNVNIRKLQIYYGELGRIYYYLGNYSEAKKYFLRNQYIAKILDDYHGRAISSKMLAKIYLNEQKFEEAYKLLSYAETYAQKIGNSWRLHKILLLINILLKDDSNIVQLHDKVIDIDSDVYQYDAYYLYSQLHYVCNDLDNALKYAQIAHTKAFHLEHKRAKELTNAWLDFLNNREIKIPTNQQIFFNDNINALKNLKNNKYQFNKVLDYYKFEELSTDRLELKMIKSKDAIDIFEYTSDFSNTKYVCWNTHKNLNDTYKYINYIHSLDNINTSMTWGIVLKENNKLIGTIDLVFNENYQEVELGYILNKKYWRKGYAKEAVEKIISFSKNTLKIKKLIGVAFKVNEASNALLQKCQFKFIKQIPNYHNKTLIVDKTGLYYELELK